MSCRARFFFLNPAALGFENRKSFVIGAKPRRHSANGPIGSPSLQNDKGWGWE